MHRGKQRWFWVLAGVLVMLGAVACGGPSKHEGPLALDFTLPLYPGFQGLVGAESLSLSDLRGKAVVLNFWAPLCPPCRAEMPDFEALWRELQGEELVIVGVDVGPFTGLGNRAQAVEFLKEIQVTYPSGQAQSAQVAKDYKVVGMPTTVFITSEGRVMRTWVGGINKAKLEELVQQLIA